MAEITHEDMLLLVRSVKELTTTLNDIRDQLCRANGIAWEINRHNR